MITYAYQWQRNGADIAGATDSTYLLTSADLGALITTRVTATNLAGSTSVVSLGPTAVIGVSTPVPVNTAVPTISGTTQQSQTLTATTGTWNNSPTVFTYAWKRGSTVIAGATASTYVLTSSDVGATITVSVIASNAGGASVAANSVATSTILPLAPSNLTVPTITGSALVGSTLTAGTGSWANAPTSYSYQWNRGASLISGATSSTYVPVSGDIGSTLTVAVIATNAGGSSSPATSAATAAVTAPSYTAPSLDFPSTANPTTVPVHIPVDAQAGDVIRLQWSQSLTFASGVTTATHTLTNSDVTGGTVTDYAIPSLTGLWYFRADNQGKSGFSNIVAFGDATAPTITTASTASNNETTTLAIALTANETISAWSIVGGADQIQFDISGMTLRWYGNGSQVYNSGGQNDYVVTVRAVDLGGNGTNKTITVSVAALDKVPDAFSFGAPVTSATPSTLYSSPIITITGVDALATTIPAAVTGTGIYYSKNGGAQVSAGSFSVTLNDTVQLFTTTPSAGNMSGRLTVSGVYSDWSVSTYGVTFNPSDKNAYIALSNNNRTATQGGAPGNSYAGVRTNVAMGSGTKVVARFNVDAISNGSNSYAQWQIAITNATEALTNYFGYSANSAGRASKGGLVYNNNNSTYPDATFPTLAAGDYLLAAVDRTANKVWFGKNGTWENGDPVAGTGGLSISFITGNLYWGFFSVDNGTACTMQSTTLSGYTSV